MGCTRAWYEDVSGGNGKGFACPALLICGEQDRAGSCIRYNKAWHKDTKIPIAWIQNAGHNSNTDQIEIVNAWIENLLNQIES